MWAEILYSSIWFHLAVIAAAFVILFRGADLFVDAAVGISENLHMPRMLVGIVIVGIGTTAPEITVSIISAMRGKSEFALGNALGSVIVDNGVALALAAILAPTLILIDKVIFKRNGYFLMAVACFTYILGFDGLITRFEGILLVLTLIGYWVWMFLAERSDKKKRTPPPEADQAGIGRHVFNFLLGLAGVIMASYAVVGSAEVVALHFGVPEVIIGLTIIAIGTSLPEISTAIVAARKNEGEIAVGNILGANILNLLWIIGVSSLVNPIDIRGDRIDVGLVFTRLHDIPSVHFSFLWMFVLTFIMLAMMRTGYSLRKREGIILLALYAIYFYMNFSMFT